MEATTEDVSNSVKRINYFTCADEVTDRDAEFEPLFLNLSTVSSQTNSSSPVEFKHEQIFIDNYQIIWELFCQFGVFLTAGGRRLIESSKFE
jgi:hypothetical protein